MPRLYPKANQVIAISQGVANDALYIVPEIAAKTQVIYNAGVDRELYDSLLENILAGTDKNVNQKKFRDREKITNPILYKVGEPKITILCDIPFTEKQIKGLKTELSVIGLVDNYQIVSVLKFKPTEKDLSKDIINFYTKNKFDLTAVIPS